MCVAILCALGCAAIVASGALAAAPSTAIEAPTEVTYTGAHLQGKVNPEAGSGTCWRFEYANKAKLEANEEGWNWANYDCFSEEDSAKSELLPVATNLANLRGGTVYLVRLTASNGEGEDTSTEEEFKTKDVTKPTVTGPVITEITGFTAKFAGTVNPNAPEPAPASAEVEAGYHTNWHFECEPGCDGGSGEIAADNSAHAVEHEAHFSPNKTYTVKLVGENAGGASVAETTFVAPKVTPVVQYLDSAPASMVTATGARIVGVIDPRESGELTSCYFEYGPTTSYGSTLPCEQEAEGGFGEIFASADLTGLSPSSIYHFRLVGGNSTGTAVGADEHFTTFKVPPAEPACPNEAVRNEQKATMLPGCRAWEMVSPVDKNGGNVELEGWNTQVSPDGNAVSYVSRGSFGDTRGSGIVGETQYISRRENGGWGEAKGIMPTSAVDQFPIFFGYTLVAPLSEDLSHGVVSALDLPTVSDDIPNGENVYWEDTRTDDLATISKSFADEPSALEFLFNGPSGFGASADQRVIAFQSNTRLLPEAAGPGVYEWEEGTLRLASILPDGSIPAAASKTFEFETRVPGYVSRDGSLVAFFSPTEGQNQLYVRRNHSSSAWVSEPEGTSVTAPENVRFEYMTPDSKHVLFSTTSQMLPADTNSQRDLYMYTDGPNPATEGNLSLISSGQDKGFVAGFRNVVFGTSDDGSYVYYGAEFNNGGLSVYRWKEGSRRLVFNAGSSRDYGEDEGVRGAPGQYRVSHDGKRFVMITKSESYPYRSLAGNLTGYEKRQVYAYDDEKEMLFCASCPQSVPGSGEEPETTTSVILQPNEAPGFDPGVDLVLPNQPHYLSGDGNHVYFSTEAALVPEDKNEAYDVYEYDIETGKQRLISSGRGESPSVFAGASADGNSVVFMTDQQLVGKDHDILRDAYESRVDGGFAEPPPPPTPCVGDGCRGPIPPAPTDPSPATPRFTGPGNPKPKHKKHRKHHQKKRHHHRRHHRGGAK